MELRTRSVAFTGNIVSALSGILHRRLIVAFSKMYEHLGHVNMLRSHSPTHGIFLCLFDILVSD